MEGERILFVEHRKSTGADCVSKGRYDCPRLLNDEPLALHTPVPFTSSSMDALQTCCLEESGVSVACRESDVNQQQETFQAASKPRWWGATVTKHLLSRPPAVRPYPYSH